MSICLPRSPSHKDSVQFVLPLFSFCSLSGSRDASIAVGDNDEVDAQSLSSLVCAIFSKKQKTPHVSSDKRKLQGIFCSQNPGLSSHFADKNCN